MYQPRKYSVYALATKQLKPQASHLLNPALAVGESEPLSNTMCYVNWTLNRSVVLHSSAA